MSTEGTDARGATAMREHVVMTRCVMSKLPARTDGPTEECPQCQQMVKVTPKGHYWTHYRPSP